MLPTSYGTTQLEFVLQYPKVRVRNAFGNGAFDNKIALTDIALLYRWSDLCLRFPKSKQTMSWFTLVAPIIANRRSLGLLLGTRWGVWKDGPGLLWGAQRGWATRGTWSDRKGKSARRVSAESWTGERKNTRGISAST